MRYLSMCALLSMVFHQALYAQRIENVKASSTAEKIVVSYDIIGSDAGQKFKVRLYGSYNNFSTPLTFVSGDVGENELQAGSKKIEWDAKSELKEFDGTITFEVRAEVIPPVKIAKKEEPIANTSITAPTETQAVKITGPSIGTKYKRGSSMDILWQGIPPAQMVKLELWKDGVVVGPIGEISHRNSFPWAIPKNTKPGSDYQIRLASGAVSVYSDHFAIKPKVPFLLKVLPVAVVGGVIFILMSGNDTPNDDGGGGPTGETLPEPPSLPE